MYTYCSRNSCDGFIEILWFDCILYNLDGYYDGLKELLNTMISFDLSSEERQKGICFANNLSDIEEILLTAEG